MAGGLRLCTQQVLSDICAMDGLGLGPRPDGHRGPSNGRREQPSALHFRKIYVRLGVWMLILQEDVTGTCLEISPLL